MKTYLLLATILFITTLPCQRQSFHSFYTRQSKHTTGYISPARHKVNNTGKPYALPFGARIRLKGNYYISAFPANVQVILHAMKKYGLILVDVGRNLYITGAPGKRWNNDELRELGKIKEEISKWSGSTTE